MSKKKHPPEAMIKDLKAVYEKYNWSGAPVGLTAGAADDSPGGCPNGSAPQVVTYQLPDGTWATKTVCV
jgi:hypothetical protein